MSFKIPKAGMAVLDDDGTVGHMTADELEHLFHVQALNRHKQDTVAGQANVEIVKALEARTDEQGARIAALENQLLRLEERINGTHKDT